MHFQEKRPIEESEDSIDDKPLSSRINKGKDIVKSPEESDDEKSLSSRYQMKSNPETSSIEYDEPDEDKPLASKLQNGFVKRQTQNKVPVNSAKRPVRRTPSGQSSVKKVKLSDASTSAGNSGVKDGDDHTPSAQRLNKAAPSSSQLLSSGDVQKWTTLVHSGVLFPPPYQPHGVKMLYDGKPVNLTSEQEEVATMYAVMMETDYAKKDKFNKNFFGDWKKLLGRNHEIQELEKCDFRPIYEWHLRDKEKKKLMTTDEKMAFKEEKLKLEEKYMWAILDGVKEKVGNFRVEPPGLFRGRGNHPKMGKIKKRIYPKDITINIGKDAPIPPSPIPGQSWKEVRHDNKVTWLAYWNDPIIPKEFKYVFLAASSTLKGQSDKEKYEKNYIDGIRTAYTNDFSSKDMTRRQIAVVTHLIDRLALREGNEKDDDETDSVGCCTSNILEGSKSHEAQMKSVTTKINELKADLSDLETDLAQSLKGKTAVEGS